MEITVMRRQQKWTEKIGEDSASIVRRILSVSHLRADHLYPDSDLRCKSIPYEDLACVDTREKKKEWTSTAIKNSDVAVPRQPSVTQNSLLMNSLTNCMNIQ